MTKADLVEEVTANVKEIDRAEAEIVVNTVLQSIIDALKSGDKIELRGFGSFRLRKRRPRQGRNPRTGERVPVPGKSVPYFKPGKELRDRLNASVKNDDALSANTDPPASPESDRTPPPETAT